MSKKKVFSIAVAAILAPSLLAVPVSAIDWNDGFTDGGYTYGNIYNGKATSLQGGKTVEEFNASKPLLQVIPGVSISVQPEDKEVTWPNDTFFRVVVDNPGNIPLHYQWSISDGERVIEPAGATSNEIMVPSTYYGMPDLYFCCIISDDNGNKIFTREAELTVVGEATQEGESRPLLSIGEFAIQPGDSFDLAAYNYGSGVVTFDDNGTDITLDNVQMNNPEPVLGWNLAQTQGILLKNTGYKVLDRSQYDPATYADMPTEYHINFIGENSIRSDYFDEVGAGNIFQTYFADADNPIKPTVYLEGEGSLNLYGGSYNYISDAHLNIGVDITTHSNGATYSGDAFGIQAIDITVEEGVNLNLNNRSTTLKAYGAGDTWGSLNVKDGTKIIATITPGIGGNKFTGNDFMVAEENMRIGKATISLTGRTIPEWFDPIDEHQLHHFVGISGGEGIEIDGATIDIDIEVPEHPDGSYTANVMGLKSGKSAPSQEKTLLSIKNSDIEIKLDAPTNIITSGINAGNDASISDSDIDIKASGIGSVSGVSVDDDLSIKDTNVNAEVKSSGGYVDPDDGTVMDETYGVLSHKFDIDMTDYDYKVAAKVNQGAAFAVVTGKTRLDPDEARPSFTPDYVPTGFTLKNKAKIMSPKDGVISGYTYNTDWGSLDYAAETIYSLADTSKPALSAVISTEPRPEPTPEPETPGDSTDNNPIIPAVPNTGAVLN